MKISQDNIAGKILRLVTVGGSRLIHFLVLCIILLLPDLLMDLAGVRNSNDSLNVYLKTVVFILVFYLEYYWVIPGNVLKGRGNWRRFFEMNTLIYILALALLFLLWRINGPYGPLIPVEHTASSGYNMAYPSLSYMVSNMIMLTLVISLAVAIKVSLRLRLMAEQRRESAMLHRELELGRLRSQINPHLLFNTLNAIYAMVEINPDHAQKAIHELSGILRYSLYNASSSIVTVRNELEFVERYCSLVKMRMGGRINLDLEIDHGNMADADIAPMLLVNAVENALKYGADCNGGPLVIHFRASDGTLSGEISNSYDPDGRRRSEGHKTGLNNMRRRLELLYSGRHKLHISDTGHRFTVRFDIDISSPPDHS